MNIGGEGQNAFYTISKHTKGNESEVELGFAYQITAMSMSRLHI